MADNEIGIKFVGDASDFNAAAGEYAAGIEAAKTKTGELVDAVETAQTPVASLATTLGGLLQGMVMGAGFKLFEMGFTAVQETVLGSVEAARQAEEAQARLGAIMGKTGEATGLTVGGLNEMASALSKTTRFSSTAINEAQALLLAYGAIGADTFPDAAQATLDLAEAMGIKLPRAADLVAEAMNDPKGALSKLTTAGAAFTDEQKEQVKAFTKMGDKASAQKVILEQLEAQFGGTAQAMGETAGGSMARFSSAVTDLQESIGGLIDGPLAKLATTGAGFIDTFTGAVDALKAKMGELDEGAAAEETALNDTVGALDAAIAKATGATAAAEAQAQALAGLAEDQSFVNQTQLDFMGISDPYAMAMEADERAANAAAVAANSLSGGFDTSTDSAEQTIAKLGTLTGLLDDGSINLETYVSWVQQLKAAEEARLANASKLEEMAKATESYRMRFAGRMPVEAAITPEVELPPIAAKMLEEVENIPSLMDALLGVDDEEMAKITSVLETLGTAVTTFKDGTMNPFFTEMAGNWGDINKLTSDYATIGLDVTLKQSLGSANEAGTTMTSAWETGFKNARLAGDEFNKTVGQIKDTWQDIQDKTVTLTIKVVREEEGGGAQHGANFIVPSGFPNDTYPLRVSSGERVIVIPQGQAGNTLNMGGVNINSGMDMSMFEYRLTRVLGGQLS